MKRIATSLALALLAVLVFAAPALAQRDPFDPVIDLTVDTGGVVDGGETGGTNGNGGPSSPSDPDARADVFPNTGADTKGWLAIAYVLLASGGLLILQARTTGSPAVRRLPRRHS